MAESWRLFCAVEIPNEIRNRVLQHIDQLRTATPAAQASWSRTDNIHLTLKFFGNVDLENISKISKAADEATSRFAPFQIRVKGTGVFPKHGTPRVLWIGIADPSGKLGELQSQFDEYCEREGFTREDRAFHPHLTVARLRSPNGARALADAHKNLEFKPADFVVSELTVFRSELSSKGSRYSVISKHTLSTDYADFTD